MFNFKNQYKQLINQNRIKSYLYENNKKRMYIAPNYTDPTFDISEDVIINLYVSDYYQTDIYRNITKEVSLYINIDGKKTIVKTITTGDSEVNIGPQSLGDHYYTVQVKDDNLSCSSELYNEFRVINKTEYEANIKNNTYNVTASDLNEYEIYNDDNEEMALKTKQGLQALINNKASAGIRKMVLLEGVYQIETEVTYSVGDSATEKEKSAGTQFPKNILQIPSNFILDLNGSTIKTKTTPWEQNLSYLIVIDKGYDSHVINGTLEGDYRRRSSDPLESGNPSAEHDSACLISADSRYSSYENLTIKLFPGYCVSFGISPSISEYCHVSKTLQNWRNIYINENGEEYVKENEWTSDYCELSEILMTKNVLRIGQYLGYGWYPQADSWNVMYHCYDKNKVYIKSIEGYMYREFVKPANTKYIRATYYVKTTDSRPDVNAYLTNLEHYIIYYYIPRNCSVKNLNFIDTRTCGLNPNQANNCLIEGCTFTKCATNITPVCVDFEDGWYLMQDYFFKNCEVLEAVGTSDIVIDAGMNLQFIGNKNIRINVQGHYGTGFVFKENNIKSITLAFQKLYRDYNRFINNTITGSCILTMKDNKKLCVPNTKFIEAIPNYDPNIYYYNAVVDMNNLIPSASNGIIAAPKGKFVKSSIKNFTGHTVMNTQIGESEYINSTFENFNGVTSSSSNETSIYINCILNNIKIYRGVGTNIKILMKDCIITNLEFKYTSWVKSNIDITIDNCSISNSNIYLIEDSFAYMTNGILMLTIKNSTFSNGCKIANSTVLNNDKYIIIKDENNIFNN